MANKKDPPTTEIESGRSAYESILNRDPDDQEQSVALGRPRAEINWDKVETCMAMGGDLKMCAKMGGVHWVTLERRILERYGDHFKDVRQYFMTDIKAYALMALRNQVTKGNWQAIKFINRAWNGMSERPKDMEDDVIDSGTTFKLAYDPTEKPPIDAECEPINEQP